MPQLPARDARRARDRMHDSIAPPLDPATRIDALAAADEQRRAFLRGAWFAASEDPTLEIAIASDPAGRPLCGLPLTRRRLGPVSIRQAAGAYWPFRGLPLDAAATPGDLAKALGSPDARGALGSVWRLGPCVADDPSVGKLREAGRLAGWRCIERRVGTLFCLDLTALRASGSWPSTKGRQKDRWRVRQLEKTGPVRIETYTGLDWADATRDAIAAIEAASWVGQLDHGGDTKFLDPAMRRYWERVAQDPALAAMIRGHVLWVGETPAAFTFGLEAGDTRYCIANNFDKQFNRFSPGRVLLYHDFEDTAERGLARIDWGIGDAGYKRPMGAHEEGVVVDLLFLRNPLLAAALAPLWQRGDA